MSTTVFILNRVPMKNLKGLTPFEVWHRRKPGVSFLRTFGCVNHVKVMKPHLSKLEDRSHAPRVQTGSKAHMKAKW
jgi:hypothetical protein